MSPVAHLQLPKMAPWALLQNSPAAHPEVEVRVFELWGPESEPQQWRTLIQWSWRRDTCFLELSFLISKRLTLNLEDSFYSLKALLFCTFPLKSWDCYVFHFKDIIYLIPREMQATQDPQSTWHICCEKYHQLLPKRFNLKDTSFQISPPVRSYFLS